MLYCLEIYDILFFDWVLLCHSNFFPHFYPELKGVVGPHMFGYNKNSTPCTLWSIFPPVLRRHGCAHVCFEDIMPCCISRKPLLPAVHTMTVIL